MTPSKAGVADLADPSLKTRIGELKATRDQARGDGERARAAIESAGISGQARPDRAVRGRRPAAHARKGRRVSAGSSAGFGQRVEVAEREVRIMGS
jgi:hypothetical protein